MLPLYDDPKHKYPPVMTLSLIVANLGVFGWQLWLMTRGQLEPFVYGRALVPAELLSSPTDPSEWLSLFTSMFLHGGFAHLLGNLWFLWIFGNNVEDRMGAGRFLLFYLLSGVGAAVVQIASAPDSLVPMIGASGAIAGVLGAYWVLFPRAVVYTFVPFPLFIVPIPAVLFLVVWFLLQAWGGLGTLAAAAEGAEGGSVAWWAHFGGFLMGILLVTLAGDFFLARGRRRSR